MAADPGLADLGALDLADRLAKGSIRSVEVVEACLARIETLEPDVQAWAWLDGAHALDQARRLDASRLAGRPTGPLHGLPVGIKDIIDTAKIPTANGTDIDAGRVPVRDAALVSRLRAAGAVVMGKTVSTELAYLDPSRTRNPRDLAHTPGGSSSGSAAAVAAGMVPLAIGSQTGGSVVRPAAFCGVVGFKPSFGAIGRTGVLVQSPTLDTVGVFARGVEDAALIADALFGHDPGDAATMPAPPSRLLDVASSAPPVTPTLAFVRPPGWAEAEDQTRLAVEELADLLGEQAFWTDLPSAFDEAAAIRRRINVAEMAKFFYGHERRGRDAMSAILRQAMDEGKSVPARDYLAALDWPGVYNAGLEQIFERCDAIVCPATLGPAPSGLESTGDAIFNGLWTLCGTPAITLPLFEAENGLPMGVQLVGRKGDDARLLRTARWLTARVTAASNGETG